MLGCHTVLGLISYRSIIIHALTLIISSNQKSVDQDPTSKRNKIFRLFIWLDNLSHLWSVNWPNLRRDNPCATPTNASNNEKAILGKNTANTLLTLSYQFVPP